MRGRDLDLVAALQRSAATLQDRGRRRCDRRSSSDGRRCADGRNRRCRDADWWAGATCSGLDGNARARMVSVRMAYDG